MSARARGLALVVGLSALAPSVARADVAALELAQPHDRSVVRLPDAVEVVARSRGATALAVEVDGKLYAPILPWTATTQLELEPGLHRINLVGLGPDASTLRSDSAQIAVFAAASDGAPLDPRARNGWTAAIAFVIAVGGAARLRRRSAP